MNPIVILIVAAILLLYAKQVLSDNSKPVTGIYFYLQLFSSLALIPFVWFNSEGKIEYKILLTVVALISLLQCFYSYKRRNAPGK